MLSLNISNVKPQSQSLCTSNIFTVQPIGDRSKEVFKLKEHALVGVSPFNSYFTESNLVKLIDWALNIFKKITIFIPDTLSCFTLLALGYSKEKAVYKARRQDTYLKNKVLRALNLLGFKRPDIDQIVMTFSQLRNNPYYQALHNKCVTAFENDSDFKAGCLSTSAWMLSNHLNIKAIGQEKLWIAVRYFLYELPLFMNSPEIFSVTSSAFIYHTIPNYLEDLYLLGKSIACNQGFLKVNLNDLLI